MDPLANCPGIYRPSETTTWYYPSNSSPKEKTFCQFCVNRGCVSKEDLTSFESNTCNCDCPCRNEHETFEVIPFVCDKCCRHPIDVSEEDLKSCRICQRRIDNGFKCCGYCSSVEKRCLICGKKVTMDDYLKEFKLLQIIRQLKATYQGEQAGITYWMMNTSDGKKKIIHMAETFRVVANKEEKEEEKEKKGFLTKIRELIFSE